jgi:bacillopeptidase F
MVTGNSSEKSDDTSSEEFFGTLTFDEPLSATNSAQISVSGAVTEYDQIEYFINNVSVKKEKIPSNDQFSEEIGRLRVGENKIHVIVSDSKTKQKKESDTYDVMYMNEKPKLEIESPKDGDTTNKNEITIKGKTDPEAGVRINNSHVVVGIDGTFTKSMRLQDGENKLEILATDIAGNQEKLTLTVKYQKDE